MPFRGTGLVQARGCNAAEEGSGGNGREYESESRETRGGCGGQRLPVVDHEEGAVVRGAEREGFGVLNHRAGAPAARFTAG